MKKYGKLPLLLTAVFALLFLMNTAVMHFYFGINILKPQLMTGDYEKEHDINSESKARMNETTSQDNCFDSTEDCDEEPVSEYYYMTADEVEFLKRRLSLSDKLTAMTIISNMDKMQIDKIYNISRDGVTADEFDEISKIAEECLSLTDIEELKEILNKNKALYAESTF